VSGQVRPLAALARLQLGTRRAALVILRNQRGTIALLASLILAV
jgi:hypothetical protein